ncbi:hypothetical protein LINPERPRIM_LOCUS37346 [Linum perenne]
MVKIEDIKATTLRDELLDNKHREKHQAWQEKKKRKASSLAGLVGPVHQRRRVYRSYKIAN